MKKLCILITMAVILSGCATVLNAPARLDRFVNRTERRADRYTTRDWMISQDRYERLLQEYIQNYGDYTRKEKQLAMSAIGRYHALLVSHGIKETVGVAEQLKAYVGGLKDILSRDLGAFKDYLEDVLGYTEKETDDIVDKLGQ